jgi:Zn-finger protein
MEPETVVKRLCPYLIFDKGEYHQCELMPYHHEEQGSGFCCCAWVGYAALPHDLGMIEMERGRDGKTHFCSSLNFPDRERPHRMTKEDVSKICPLRLTFEEIDARVACARELANKEPDRGAS